MSEPNGASEQKPDGSGQKADISRRTMVGYLAAVPFALAFEGEPETLLRAAERAKGALAARAAGAPPFVPEFFTEAEFTTVRVLADLVIPRDDRSGSATDAAVPEYMDFVLTDTTGSRDSMRNGLAWLDAESLTRFGAAFADASPGDQTLLLDDIAWPDRAPEAVADGVRFFNLFRDMTGAGFFSSKMGVEDLQYMGNTFILNWEGCPDEACEKLGVSYEEQWEG
jgi:hypothetical protein